MIKPAGKTGYLLVTARQAPEGFDLSELEEMGIDVGGKPERPMLFNPEMISAAYDGPEGYVTVTLMDGALLVKGNLAELVGALSQIASQ